MSIAFLFPGQESQRSGMLHRLPDTAATATVLAEADVALRTLTPLAGPESVEDWTFPDGIAELDTSRTLEESPSAVGLSVLIASLAGARALMEDEEVVPSLVAGHGTGCWAAAVTTGVLTFEEALRASRLHGALLESGESGPKLVAVRLAQHLATIPRRAQSLPYVAGETGRAVRHDADAVLDDLARSAAAPAGPPGAPAAAVAAEGAVCAVEMPPGRMLTGAASGGPGLRTVSVEELGVVDAADAALGGDVTRRRDAALERELGEEARWGAVGGHRSFA